MGPVYRGVLNKYTCYRTCTGQRLRWPCIPAVLSHKAEDAQDECRHGLEVVGKEPGLGSIMCCILKGSQLGGSSSLTCLQPNSEILLKEKCSGGQPQWPQAPACFWPMVQPYAAPVFLLVSKMWCIPSSHLPQGVHSCLPFCLESCFSFSLPRPCMTSFPDFP